MKAIPGKVTKGLQVGSVIPACDNSGAKMLRITSVIGRKSVKGRNPGCGVSDLVMASVIKGKADIRKRVVYAVIVRQKKEYRRANGKRISFEDNAAVVLKDEKGNPKGTMLKGPIAKEATGRWAGIAKIATIIV